MTLLAVKGLSAARPVVEAVRLDFLRRERDAVDDAGHVRDRFRVAVGKLGAERLVKRLDVDAVREEELRQNETRLARRFHVSHVNNPKIPDTAAPSDPYPAAFGAFRPVALGKIVRPWIIGPDRRYHFDSAARWRYRRSGVEPVALTLRIVLRIYVLDYV